MQKFVDAALGPHPPTQFITGRITRPLNDGKSGAHVFELEGGRVLKLYPARGAGHVHDDFHLKRSLRDIVMTCITPDAISPHVYEFGVSHDMRPFMVMQKIDGVELFSYAPVGGADDVHLLLNIVQALRQFNASFRYFCRFYGLDSTIRPCHRDLHPHNIFVTHDGVRFIDFDLAVCPLAALRDSDSPQRQRALRHPWLQWVLGNYSRSTEEYVHWTNVFDRVPPIVSSDSDMLQIYAICRYFERRTPGLKAVTVAMQRSADKDDFLRRAHDGLQALLVGEVARAPPVSGR
jgi:serine/threonine protein kinase